MRKTNTLTSLILAVLVLCACSAGKPAAGSADLPPQCWDKTLAQAKGQTVNYTCEVTVKPPTSAASQYCPGDPVWLQLPPDKRWAFQVAGQ